MSRAAEHTAEIVPFPLQGGAGTLAAWDCAPTSGVSVRGTAVLVPGFTGSKEDFAAMLPILATAGFRCVAYDQRGQFESDGPADPAGYGIDDFSADLIGITETLGAPVHVVGHSFGGYVARTAVVQEPQRFRSLTLLASGPSSLQDINFPPPAQVARFIEAGGQEAVWQQLSPLLVASGVDEAKTQFLHRRILATKKANLLGILRTMEQWPVAPARVRDTGVPILVGYGDSGDLWAPAVHDRFAAELGARTVVYPGVGHLPNEERPHKVCDDLLAFWEAGAA
ncbi:alpha/beta fold hydrolase [Nocardia transvalensis]|uniref:alpha/beta fold hydrolase n=1 Tax=Nocardia transvalensis TaxID=37333 RepID=UPI001894EF73|nr:alpha/beta hydrolase [Nocardia transvalensis]MBF6328025.1 alpha/beta hydrolase [Nocardia transvalensis]